MTEKILDRVAELFRKEFSEYENIPAPVLEIMKDFNTFRLGYYHGGLDALTEFSAKMKGKDVVRGGKK